MDLIIFLFYLELIKPMKAKVHKKKKITLGKQF